MKPATPKTELPPPSTQLRKAVFGGFQTILCVFVLVGSLFTAHAQSPSTGPQLKLESRTNAFELTVSSLSATGALFVFQATNPQTLVDSPSLLLGTNTLSTNDVRVPMAPAAGPDSQAFFSASYYPDQSLDEFGDPEAQTPEAFPDKLLFTSDLPPNLGTGLPFTVDFFITDATGQPVAISGTATILVVRESDGAAHPDASVTPSPAQMTNGYMRVVITVNSATPLDGYTLGLSIAPGFLGLLHSLVSSTFLKAVSGLGPAPLTQPKKAYWTQLLEQHRLDNADLDPSWNDPLPNFAWSVSGTFGEWRGDNDKRSHYGVDLGTAGTTNIAVKPSRSGVVSRRGTVSTDPMGDYIVVDHGGGVFSGYWHLDPGSIGVKEGQAVVRGQTTLATNLFARTPAQVSVFGKWGTHLHFEIRTNATSAWGDGKPGGDENTMTGPGTARDALADPNIFSIPPKHDLPKLNAFGLTQQHPGQTVFQKTATPTFGGTTVYVFAQFIDPEAGRTLGLRSLCFQPEGSSASEIRPSNAVAIATYLPPGTGKTNGFARYKLTAQKANQKDWFRYWWKWDTSIYTNATGPRSFVLTGVDYGGATSNYTFTFGPKIISVVPNYPAPGQCVFTTVAYLGTNSLPALTQRDRYKMEIIQANGTVLPGVQWGTPITNGLTPVLTTHLQTNSYTFTLPANTIPDGLKLRVSSRLATNIAHQVEFCWACSSVPFPFPCAPGYTVGIVETWSSSWTWTCTGSDGVPVNCSAPRTPGYGEH